MANLEGLTRYKETLMKAICTSTKIVDLVKCSGEESLGGRQMMYHRVFPYWYVPDTSEDAQTFICFDVDVGSARSEILNKMIIKVYVMCHQDIMRLSNGGGMRIDVLASEIDKIMNGSTKFGLGKCELQSVTGFAPATKYYGREMRYVVNDLTRSICGALI